MFECLGQSSRTESSNQLDATEDHSNLTTKPIIYYQSLIQSSSGNIPYMQSSEIRTMSSTEESSSVSSSDEENCMNVKTNRDTQCHEPIFVKV